MNEFVSIVIASYNRNYELVQCINSIKKQDYEYIEIIVVDDCSDESVEDFLSQIFFDIKIISNVFHVGPSFARNQGILLSRGKYILFLDSDSEFVSETTIGDMVKILEENEGYGSIGGEIIASEYPCKGAYGRVIGFDGFPKAVIAGKGDMLPVVCDYLATCNCMIRRSILFDIGGFDPYWEFGGEDVDIGFMIQKKGYTNIIRYDTSVLHKRSKNGRLVNEQYLYQRARVRFLIKHCGFIRIILVSIIDIGRVMRFYFLLPIKLVFRLLLKHEVINVNFYGGFFIFKSYMWNIYHIYTTIKSRNTNFLCDRELENFSNIKKIACQQSK